MISQPPGDCQMMGGALAWASGRTAGVRLGATVRPELRPETTRVIGGSTPSCLHCHQTMDLRVIGAQHQLHHQCHQCLRGQEDPSVHAMADVPTGNQEAI